MQHGKQCCWPLQCEGQSEVKPCSMASSAVGPCSVRANQKSSHAADDGRCHTRGSCHVHIMRMNCEDQSVTDVACKYINKVICLSGHAPLWKKVMRKFSAGSLQLWLSSGSGHIRGKRDTVKADKFSLHPDMSSLHPQPHATHTNRGHKVTLCSP